MAKVGAPQHEPVPIGDVATPPFVRLPDPATLVRVARRSASGRSPRSRSQALPAIPRRPLRRAAPASGRSCRRPICPKPMRWPGRANIGMPPLDRSRFLADPVFELTLDALPVARPR